MKITPVVIAAALLTLAAVPGSAGPFSAIYAFGDSLPSTERFDGVVGFRGLPARTARVAGGRSASAYGAR
jgi:hypothetical protein